MTYDNIINVVLRADMQTSDTFYTYIDIIIEGKSALFFVRLG